jgi:hypothetical protein
MLNMTGSSEHVGFGADGQHIGLMPGGVPQGTASPVAIWQMERIEAKPAEVAATGATDQSQLSVLALASRRANER